MNGSEQGALGRREPTDWEHVEKYPLTAAFPELATTDRVERTLRLPGWHWTHDQGSEGACVGFGSTMMMSLLNRQRYDAFELYRAAQRVDEWPGEDYSGTSVRAAMDVLRDRGPARVRGGRTGDPDTQAGIAANRWAVSTDELRASIASGIPATIGVNWYRAFDRPEQVGKEFWIGRDGNLREIRGGHAVCIYGASDRRQAFRMKNSWGRGYPLVWIPYAVMQRLLNEDGEATLVTDR